MLFNVWCKQHWEPNLSGGFTKNTKNKWWLKCRDPTAVKLYRAYHDGFLAKPNNISLYKRVYFIPPTQSPFEHDSIADSFDPLPVPYQTADDVHVG